MEKFTFGTNNKHIDQNYLEQTKLLQKLKSVKNTEERVKLFATILDQKGVDLVLGLIPGLGDGAVGFVASAYLLIEAKLAGLSKKDMLKILGHQAYDMGIGLIPGIGDIADYFNKANMTSLKYFQKNTEAIVKEARAKNISEEKIQAIMNTSKKVYSTLEWGAKNKTLQTTVQKGVEKIISKKKDL